MNKEAFDAFSQNGYLCSLEVLLQESAPDMIDELKPYLVTREYPTGLDISQKGLFKQASFEDTVYLGVITNSPRMNTAVEYIKNLSLFKAAGNFQQP